MLIFEPMTLDKAKEFYERLKVENPSNQIIKVALDNIWFFTDGLTKDYGGTLKNE